MSLVVICTAITAFIVGYLFRSFLPTIVSLFELVIEGSKVRAEQRKENEQRQKAIREMEKYASRHYKEDENDDNWPLV